jgi:hypothetical protein
MKVSTPPQNKSVMDDMDECVIRGKFLECYKFDKRNSSAKETAQILPTRNCIRLEAFMVMKKIQVMVTSCDTV